MSWSDALYESWYDGYGQPLLPGLAPYLSPVQRADVRRRVLAGLPLSLGELQAVMQGQLGPELQAAWRQRQGGAQSLPPMQILGIASGAGAFVALMLILTLFRRR